MKKNILFFIFLLFLTSNIYSKNYKVVCIFNSPENYNDFELNPQILEVALNSFISNNLNRQRTTFNIDLFFLENLKIKKTTTLLKKIVRESERIIFLIDQNIIQTISKSLRNLLNDKYYYQLENKIRPFKNILTYALERKSPFQDNVCIYNIPDTDKLRIIYESYGEILNLCEYFGLINIGLPENLPKQKIPLSYTIIGMSLFSLIALI
ncbi:MAG: hypothetical protein ABIF12_03280 [bacterium]